MVGVVNGATVLIVVHHVVDYLVFALEAVYFRERAQVLAAITSRQASRMGARISDSDIGRAVRVIVDMHENCCVVPPAAGAGTRPPPDLGHLGVAVRALAGFILASDGVGDDERTAHTAPIDGS